MKAVRKYDNGGDIVKKLAKARDKAVGKGKQYFKEGAEGIKEEVTSLSKSLKKSLGKALGTTTQSKGSKSVPAKTKTKTISKKPSMTKAEIEKIQKARQEMLKKKSVMPKKKFTLPK